MESKTMSVQEAGRVYFGMARNRSYEAAREGIIPTIKVGRKLRVPIAAMERKFQELADQGSGKAA